MKKLINVLVLFFSCVVFAQTANADELSLGYGYQHLSLDTAIEGDSNSKESFSLGTTYLNYEANIGKSSFLGLGGYATGSDYKQISLGLGYELSEQTKFVAVFNNRKIDHGKSFDISENEIELYAVKTLDFEKWQVDFKFGGSIAKGDYNQFYDVTTVGILFEPSFIYKFNDTLAIKLAYLYKASGSDDKYESSANPLDLLEDKKQIARDIDRQSHALTLAVNATF
jgi:hypothetical protein